MYNFGDIKPCKLCGEFPRVVRGVYGSSTMQSLKCSNTECRNYDYICGWQDDFDIMVEKWNSVMEGSGRL